MPDDAYLLGIHGGTGTRVAIGEQKHAIARLVRFLVITGERIKIE
ncbi:hypothetical protein WCLP8_2220001 [uncultured Gammaproteobacteria bacterium]